MFPGSLHRQVQRQVGGTKIKRGGGMVMKKQERVNGPRPRPHEARQAEQRKRARARRNRRQLEEAREIGMESARVSRNTGRGRQRGDRNNRLPNERRNTRNSDRGGGRRYADPPASRHVMVGHSGNHHGSGGVRQKTGSNSRKAAINRFLAEQGAFEEAADDEDGDDDFDEDDFSGDEDDAYEYSGDDDGAYLDDNGNDYDAYDEVEADYNRSGGNRNKNTRNDRKNGRMGQPIVSVPVKKEPGTTGAAARRRRTRAMRRQPRNNMPESVARVIKEAQEEEKKHLSGVVRAFVVTPCFGIPGSDYTANEYNHYANLCSMDSILTFQESPVSPRLMLSAGDIMSTKFTDEQKKARVMAWISSANRIVLYTDLGVSPFMQEIILYAGEHSNDIQYRLLGQLWTNARKVSGSASAAASVAPAQPPIVKKVNNPKPQPTTQTRTKPATTKKPGPIATDHDHVHDSYDHDSDEVSSDLSE